MKSAVWKGYKERFVIQDLPQPKPDKNELLIRVRYCGICGTDLHLIEAGLIPVGAVLGHEVSGKVVEVGEGVEEFKPGDQVAIRPYSPCGSCPACLSGQPNICPQGLELAVGFGKNPGGFAQYLVVDKNQAWKLSRRISLREAVLAEPLASAVHAVRKAEVKIGDSALILGGGPMGALLAIALRWAGAHRIVISEPSVRRRNIIKDLGFGMVVDPAKTSPLHYFDYLKWKQPELVFDCAGRRDSLAQAIELCAPGGKVVMTGLSWEQVLINSLECLGKELRLISSFSYFQEFEVALDIITSDLFEFHTLITTIMPLDQINQAFERLKPPSKEMKVLIEI